MKILNEKQVYNETYVEKHKLSNKKIKEAGIELLGNDEVFVQYPKWKDYYGSNYGRLISVKYQKVELLKGNPSICESNKEDNEYYIGYKLTKVTKGVQRKLSISAHRLVADIFLPNYWENLPRNSLGAHHLDHSKTNNYYKNLILLPVYLHKIMNTVKKIALFRNHVFRNMNPYEIMCETGLSLEQIILSTNKKPLKTQGKYSIFEVNGFLIGFQFNCQNDKKGNKRVLKRKKCRK